MPGDPVPLLQELIRAGPEPKASLELVKQRFKGFHTAESQGVLWVQGSDRPRLVLSGHLDVVPAGQGWSRDPFGGEVLEGEVWGRGACDMRGAVAAMLAAIEEVGPGDWALALTPDEETGMAGAHRLAEGGALEGADLIVVGEPTNLDLGLAHRGVLWLEVETKGKAAHGGTPQKGDSAIAKMRKLLDQLDGFALPEVHGLVGGSTMNIGRIEGGAAVNVVPAQCTAQIDLRVPPPGSTAAARKALEAALGKAGVPFTARVLSEHDPFETPRLPLIDRVRAMLREARPQAQVVGLPYGTEASVYQRFAPCVVAGPGALDRMHVPDERVAVADVRAAQRFYRGLLRMWS